MLSLKGVTETRMFPQTCMSTFYAHIDGERRQSIEKHLQGTAVRASTFAEKFGAAEQGYFLGMLHDIGKYSDEFQKRLMGGSRVDHATAGAVESGKTGALWAAFCIAGHHSGLPDEGNPRTDPEDAPTLCGRLQKGLKGRIPDYRKNWNSSVPTVLPPPAWGGNPITDSFLIRMLYSCLVDADYLDTEYFMKDGETGRGTYDSIDVLAERFEQYIAPWRTPKNELNRLRCDILETCQKASQGEKGLYSLTVPTGGGKTVSSMAFALGHAKEHRMSRIIYVIPYTSIIEQNAAVFRGIFGDENVVEHHSGVLSETDEETGGQVSRAALAAENWDAPIIVTTAVQFFESLYANRSSQCRKLHSIADSVIVFDEAQMLPTAHLRPCTAAISELVTHFGATAVLCTATQPTLNDLFSEYTGGMVPREICPHTEELDRRFCRVSFRMAGKMSVSALAEALSALPQVLCIVNTRLSAHEIFEALPNEGSFHLSTLMCPEHRRTVLEEIRGRLASGLPCRVVSTSLIEAGVDVDFPAVYRELAGLDSVLQAAGRCNREGKRSADDSIVTVFEGETPPPPLFSVNIGAANEVLSAGFPLSDPRTVQRYFTAYRSLSGNKLDKYGVVKAFEKGIEGCEMPFASVAERFHLIDNAAKTIYIPRGEGASLIRRLQNGECSKMLYRQAGQYAVNVYEQHFQSLLAAGDIKLLCTGCAVLENLSLYDDKTGLSLEADAGKALFV